MTRIAGFFHWLLGKPAPDTDPITTALAGFGNPEADTLELIRQKKVAIETDNSGGAGEIRLRLREDAGDQRLFEEET